MRQRTILCTAGILAGLAASAMASDAVTTLQPTETGVVLELEDGQLELAACSERAIRVTFTPPGAQPLRPSLVVVNPCEGFTEWEVAESSASVVLSTAAVEARVDRSSGAVSFVDPSGRVVLAESAGGRMMEAAQVLGENTYHAEQRFDWAVDEGLYGLGFQQSGLVNYRGHDVQLVQSNMQTYVPVLTSSRGYALLWDNPSQAALRDAPSPEAPARDGKRPGGLWWEVADAIDYYFLYGPDLDRVVAEYRSLTGQTPLFPKWALGLFQSKERYRTQEEITGVVREFRRRSIPLDVIVQDWFYWDPFRWGSHRFSRERFPDPAEMMGAIHEMNARIMISVWAMFVPGSDNHTEMAAKGFLFPQRPSALGGLNPRPEQYYDAFNPKARELYWLQISEQLFAKGIDAWWLDATEPDMGDLTVPQTKATLTSELGSGARYLNAFPLMTTGGVYKGQREEAPGQRVFILTRSAFGGQQRNAAATWTGDIVSTWEVFANQVAAGINFGMTGIPYWTTDIGAFTVVGYPRGHVNPAYRELFTRWFQWGAFCPIFRVHGATTPREMWRFGEPGDWAYDAQLTADRLRYRLMPYVYSLAGQVTHDSGTILRSLLFDFRGDPNVRDIRDQHMYGPAFLVSPVLEPLYMEQWRDASTGTVIPSTQLLNNEGQPGGLTAQYYLGTNFETPVETRVDPVVDFSWTDEPPLPGMPTDNFSIRWTGQVMAQRTGEYTFMTSTDDGARLWVDGKQLIDDWVDHAPEYREGQIRLEAGKAYDIKLEYYEAGGGALVKLLWIPEQDAVLTASPTGEAGSRRLYLPAGTAWFDFWTGQSLRGGQTITAPAPMDHMPLHVRAGAIVPMGPDLQYTGEKQADPIELRVYRGADGSFALYEDDGESYEYENGAFATIPFEWDDKAGQLTIGARESSFEGMLVERTFHVVWVDEGHGVGVEPTQQPDAVVEYAGTPLTVRVSGS